MEVGDLNIDIPLLTIGAKPVTESQVWIYESLIYKSWISYSESKNPDFVNKQANFCEKKLVGASNNKL